MLKVVAGLLQEVWRLFIEMSPWLLLGFMVAGFLHIMMPREKIYRHFSGSNISSVIKASLFGVPLPLCSCGVIPVAAHLRKEGASRGSTLSFLISTPTTGVDSILATYSLLGPLFAIIRPVAAFFSGILAGGITNMFDKGEKTIPSRVFYCAICDVAAPHSHKLIEKLKAMFKYGFMELVEDIGRWLLIGILVGGVIGYFIPANIVERYLGNTRLAYPLMLLIAIPMYVCATGSIPIAASLILKGMTPGAGLVLLIAGPATNTATLSFVGGRLGRRTLFIYLFTIITTAVLFGLVVDHIWQVSGKDMGLLKGGMRTLPQWLKTASGILLAGLILMAMLRRLRRPPERGITSMGVILRIPDMTCEHCKRTIEKIIKKLDGVRDVRINLKTKEVEVTGNVSKETIITAIEEAGYSIEDTEK